MTLSTIYSLFVLLSLLRNQCKHPKVLIRLQLSVLVLVTRSNSMAPYLSLPHLNASQVGGLGALASLMRTPLHATLFYQIKEKRYESQL